MSVQNSVLTEERDAVLLVTLNRPEARNAVDIALAEGLAAAIETLDSTDRLRAGVLTGAGPTFCAGMDLKAFLAGERAEIPGRGFAGIVQAPPRKPLIAAVEGHALAGGFEVALACDVIVASRSASFGLPEARLGLVAVGGGLIHLPKRLPYHAVMEMALGGEAISAERAHELGLVGRLTEKGEALAEALRFASRVAANGPLAVQATKEVVRRTHDWSADEAWREQERITGPVFSSEDAREGARSFTERRAPVWKGR